MMMLKLWRWFCLRHLISYKGRTLLCLLGVALGVAVFVGIKTAASSALTSSRSDFMKAWRLASLAYSSMFCSPMK